MTHTRRIAMTLIVICIASVAFAVANAHGTGPAAELTQMSHQTRPDSETSPGKVGVVQPEALRSRVSDTSTSGIPEQTRPPMPSEPAVEAPRSEAYIAPDRAVVQSTLPNLTPYQLSGWSDKIVVSKTPGTNSDSSPLTPTDTLYVDWAVINNGNTATAVGFYTELYVDGSLRTSWYADPPYNPNDVAYVEDYSIGSLPAGTHTIRIKTDSTGAITESNEADNEYTKTIVVTSASQACTPGPSQLCLNNSRFGVSVSWQDFSGNTGVGTAVPITGDTGYFWFFGSSNVELVIKVLDGRPLNGSFWVFYGALSNVQYTITVIDEQTGASKQYVNPSGTFASVGDTGAFSSATPPRLTASEAGARPEKDMKTAILSSLREELVRISPSGATTGALPALRTISDDRARRDQSLCSTGDGTLCLNGSRFAVSVTWKDFSGNSGSGHAVPLTSDTGYFWFFGSSNVELIIKVLDGSTVNGEYWVFYGALSNVEYTMTVQDTVTGQSKIYHNPSGQFGSVGDTSAFSSTPVVGGPLTLTVAIDATGAGRGTVTSSPIGVNCGATCSASFARGASVTLTAIPATGSTFIGWSAACSGTATTCTVTMNDNISVTVTFGLVSGVTGIYFYGGVVGFGDLVNGAITPDGLSGISITCNWLGNLGSKATETITTLNSLFTCSNAGSGSWPDTSLTISATVTGTTLTTSTGVTRVRTHSVGPAAR